MDCAKFDQHLLDALYDELDEVTHAAMKRHMETCAKCANTYAGLRATRELAAIPLEEPSSTFEARVLEAAEAAHSRPTWTRRALRGLAWAGSHAMRRETAMAAVAVLMIGSSVLLLRAKPGTTGAPVSVTERGAPAPDSDEAAANAPAAPPPVAAAEPNAAVHEAPGDGREDEKAKRERQGAADVDSEAKKNLEKGGSDAQAALASARAARGRLGCSSDVMKQYDDVGVNFPATPAAAAARWELASCYKQSGDTAKARELYLSLRETDGYRDRPEVVEALAAANTIGQNGPGGRPAAAAAAPRAAAAPAKAAAPGSTGKAPAAAEKRATDTANGAF